MVKVAMRIAYERWPRSAGSSATRLEHRRGLRVAVLAALGVLLLVGVAYAATGELTQKAGTDGCISDTGSSGVCQDGRELVNPYGLAVSPDGKSVYVGSEVSDAVTIFDRDLATGALTQKAGTAGCVSETGTAGTCQDGVALDGPGALPAVAGR